MEDCQGEHGITNKRRADAEGKEYFLTLRRDSHPNQLQEEEAGTGKDEGKNDEKKDGDGILDEGIKH